jgi:hypothetical protein
VSAANRPGGVGAEFTIRLSGAAKGSSRGRVIYEQARDKIAVTTYEMVGPHAIWAIVCRFRRKTANEIIRRSVDRDAYNSSGSKTTRSWNDPKNGGMTATAN